MGFFDFLKKKQSNNTATANELETLLQQAASDPSVRKDGSLFKARVVITAIHNDDGDVVGYTKVTRDLTNVLPGSKS